MSNFCVEIIELDTVEVAYNPLQRYIILLIMIMDKILVADKQFYHFYPKKFCLTKFLL